MKSVQISLDLFLDIFSYFELEHVELAPKIVRGIDEKLDALARHELYSKYKNKQLSDEEREEARKKYLDLVGMHIDFRF